MVLGWIQINGPEAVEIADYHRGGNDGTTATHLGEVLREKYLVPLGLSARTLAKLLDVPANRISEIMRGTRDVTADTAIRLGRYFGTDPCFWLNLQAAHDLSKAEKAHSYRKIVPRKAARKLKPPLTPPGRARPAHTGACQSRR